MTVPNPQQTSKPERCPRCGTEGCPRMRRTVHSNEESVNTQLVMDDIACSLRAIRKWNEKI